MRRVGIVIIVVGMVFLVSGIAAAAWAASQAYATSEEDRTLDSEQYDFYCSAQSCSLGGAVIGLIIVTTGILIGRRSTLATRKDQGKDEKEGVWDYED